MTDIHAAMEARMKKLAEAAEKGEVPEEIIVQQRQRDMTFVYTIQEGTLLNEVAHAFVREHNKTEVQVLTIEKYQWYNIEIAKAVSMNENRWLVDWIFNDGQERGYSPFTIRPIRTHNEGYTHVYERPTVKPERPDRDVHKWFIPWKHNVECPGFITYSTLPFKHDNLYYRLIDIDFGDNGEEDQVWNYCDWEEYKHYYDLLCDANMKARRMEMTDVAEFQKFLQKAVERISDKLVVPKERVWFTGGGFRILMQASSNEILTKVISDLKAKKLICSSSTTGYQAQKLFSVQTIKPHFQTEINPFSQWFKYSNPGFFVIKYDKGLLEKLILYYNTYLRRTYFDADKNVVPPEQEIYSKMSEEQKCLEKNILALL